MLVFPQWRPEVFGDGCRVPRWMPAERFAPYVARTVVIPAPVPQVEDESSGDSFPERLGEQTDVVCMWRGCGLRLPSVARLSAHVARAHGHARPDGLFYCGWTNCTRPQKGFNARYKMLVHVRTHTNERPHTCNQCNKSFSRAENLKIHLRSHSGEKPYVCPYEGCGKAYSNSSDRFKHTRTHTIDKPYYCKVLGCDKRYTDPSSLRKHVKTYKHFTPKDQPKQDSSDETRSPETYGRENNSIYPTSDAISPQRPISYTPPDNSISPDIPPYNRVLPLTEPVQPIEYPIVDRVTYIRPLEPVYPIRVPTQEMSYTEYTQMYEHAYRNYYSNAVSYPIVAPNISEKSYPYKEHPHIEDVAMENVKDHEYGNVRYTSIEDMPLNLKCEKRLQCKPIENLVRHIDLPLDLSIRTSIETYN